MTIAEAVRKQQTYFLSGITRPVSFRRRCLKKLYTTVIQFEDEITKALASDLSKPPFETYATETGMVLSELNFIEHHIARWAKSKKVPTAAANFPAKSIIQPDPYGVVLVLSPWNYPFMLAMTPLINAVAAGNCVVVKPSRYAPETAAVIERIVSAVFPPELVTVISGGHEANNELLKQHFDFIFFTGSTSVGKIVMKAAAAYLTPVCLELGGKNPCIVDASANIELAAKRIVWGKFINAGQTCVAPDYILVQKDCAAALVGALHKEITKQYGKEPVESPSLAKIINEKHFLRLKNLAPQAVSNPITNKIAPTIIELGPLTKAGIEDPLMKEEIFGPLLPVITWDSIDEVIHYVTERNKPLALYLFSTDRKQQKLITRTVRYGGGCINDVVVHLASTSLPFGGIGESGMGAYHGKTGFDTFTHYKSILFKSNRIDIPVRYAPYGGKLSILKRFLH